MTRVLATEGAPVFAGDPVGPGHLGANFLFNRETFDEGVGDGGFDEITRHLGVTHLRYPGGTITEQQFDPANPDNTFQRLDLSTGLPLDNPNQFDLTPLSDFLAFAADAGAKVSIVVPSIRYRDAILLNEAEDAAEEIRTFIRDVLSGPNGDVIEAFEIGNEWYALDFFSAREYGRVADQLAIWIAEGIAAAAPDTAPLIAVQAGQRAARLSDSQAIIDALSVEARAVIDAVILHNYRPMPWEEAGVTTGKFDHVALFETALGRPLQTIVSEWNVGNASDADGLLQAGGVLAMFDQMLRLGMDLGHIWPLFENNTTRLAGDVAAPDALADLHAAGEVYRQMLQSLEGLRSAVDAPGRDLDGDGTLDLLVHAYADGPGDGAVAFLSSLSATALTVDFALGALEGHVPVGGTVWLTRVGVAEGADPLDPAVFPLTHAVAVTHMGELTLTLAAYETLRLEYAGPGLAIRTHDDPADLTIFTGSTRPDVFLMADDGVRDIVRRFDLAEDRFDISAWGATGMDEIEIIDLVRRNGTTSWVQIHDADGDAELILRFADGSAPEAARLTTDHFIFAPIEPEIPRIDVTDTAARDDLRLTVEAERVILSDDGVRDVVRDFDLDLDLFDLSALPVASFSDLEIVNLVRRNGTTSWVEVRGPDGEPHFILRYADGAPLDAAQLTEDHFTFG